MILLNLFFIIKIQSAELSTIRLDGKISKINESVICVKNGESNTCFKRKKEFEDYLSNTNKNVSIILDKNDLIKDERK